MTGKILTEKQKWVVLAEYYKEWDPFEQKLVHGAMKVLTERFNITSQTIRNIVDEYETQRVNAVQYPDLAPKKRGRVGAESDLSAEVAECIVEFNSMKGYKLTLHDFTVQFNEMYGIEIPKSTMNKYMHLLHMTMHNSFIKPKLTKSHRIDRLKFVLQKLVPNDNGNFQFRDLSHVIHIDEKWFYTDRKVRKYRHFPGEERHTDPTAMHQSHIEKVMFIAVVGVPQDIPLEHGGGYFDGKIGLFPVTKIVLAQRNSVHRPRGAEVIENMSLTAEEYYQFMTKPNGILHAIKTKMPWLRQRGIEIQHDGASPHTGKGNKVRLNVIAQENDWNMNIIVQPAQSPDLNKLDLCPSTACPDKQIISGVIVRPKKRLFSQLNSNGMNMNQEN
jgi:hypothetical protein